MLSALVYQRKRSIEVSSIDQPLPFEVILGILAGFIVFFGLLIWYFYRLALKRKKELDEEQAQQRKLKRENKEEHSSVDTMRSSVNDIKQSQILE